MPTPDKELVDEIFRVTNRVVSEDDPVVTAAFFFSHKIRQAAQDSAAQLEKSAGATLASAAAAEAACVKMQKEQALFLERMSRELNVRLHEDRAERGRLAGDLDSKLQRWLKSASRFHSTDGSRLIPAWYAYASFFAGAAVLAASAWGICGINSSTIHELQVGRQFSKSWQYFDAGLRKRLLEEMDKDRR